MSSSNSSPEVPAYKKLWGDVKKLLDEKSTVHFEDNGKAFSAVVERIRDKEAIDFAFSCLERSIGIFVDQRVSAVQSHLLIHFENVFIATCDIALFDIFENRSTRFLAALAKVMDPTCKHYEDEYEFDNRTRQKHLRSHGASHIRQKVIQKFIEKKGFDQLQAMIKGEIPINNNENIDLDIYCLLLAPFVKSSNLLPSDIVKNISSYTMSQVDKISPERLAKEKPDDLIRIINLFIAVFGYSSKELRIFSLSLASKCFLSKVFPMQKFGLETLIRLMVDAHKNSLAVTPTKLSSKAAVSEDIFGDEQMSQWLSKNQILENLFDDAKNTHPALVSKSKDLMEFMMKMNVMRDDQIDLVFKSSVGQHESTRGAIHALLAELVLSSSVPVDKSRYILQCASKSIQDHHDDVVFFVEKLIECGVNQQEQMSHLRHQNENNNRKGSNMITGSMNKLLKITDLDPKVAESLLDIVWNLLVTCESIHDPKRNSLTQYIIDILANSQLSSLRENYISKCLFQLRSINSFETESQAKQSQVKLLSAYTVLIGIVSLHPTNSKPLRNNNEFGDNNSSKLRSSQDSNVRSPSLTQEVLIDILETDHQLIDLIIDETGNFQAHANEIEYTDRIFLLQSRLDSLQYFLTKSEKLLLSFDQIKRLWKILENDRGLCFVWLQQIVLTSLNSNSTTFTCISGEVINSFFSDILCSKDAFSDLTEDGFQCFAAFFLIANIGQQYITGEMRKSISKSNSGNNSSINNNRSSNLSKEIVTNEIVITSCSVTSSEQIIGYEALWRLIIISSSIRASMMATNLLLQVQIHMEDIPLENVRNHFMEKIFSYLSSISSDNPNQIVNAIRLLSSYLRLYELPSGLDPHEPARGKDLYLSIHHDETLTHSDADIGKIIEKRFRSSGQSFQWFKGYFTSYDRKQDRHRVWFTDNDVKEYDMTTMTRVDTAGNMVFPPIVPLSSTVVASSAKGDMQFRLLPARLSQSLLKSITITPPESAQRASISYKPINIKIKEKASLTLLKSKILQAIYQTTGKESFYFGARSMILRVVESSRNPQLPKQYKLLPTLEINSTSSTQNGSSYHIGSLLNNETELSLEFIPRVKSSLAANSNNLFLSYQSPILMIVDGKNENQSEIDFFEILMNIISNSQISIISRSELWDDILMKLPTNRNILKSIKDSDDWLKYLDIKYLLRGIYFLQVAEELLLQSQSSQQQNSDSEFYYKFLKNGHLSNICSLLNSLVNGDKNDNNNWEKTVAFPVLVRVIKICIKEQKGSSPIFKDLITSLSNLLVILLNLQKSDENKNISTKFSSDDLDLVCGDIIEIIEMILNIDILLVENFITKEIPIVEALLVISSASVREKLRKLLLRICTVESNEKCVEMSRILIQEHAAKSLEFVEIENSDASSASSADLFHFITELVKKNSDVLMQDLLIDVITNRIVGYKPSIISSNSFDDDEGATPSMIEQKANSIKNQNQQDSILIGFLDLLIVLLRSRSNRCSDPKIRDRLLQCIFHSYLIAIPTPDDKKKCALATSHATRSRSYSLLLEIARSDKIALDWISSSLQDFINSVPYPPSSAKNPRAEWCFRADDTRKSTNFLGLINMGATCYQNSVLQQLFMQPVIREIILNSYCPEENRQNHLQSRRGSTQEDQIDLSSASPDKKDLFRTLQRTFRFLGDSAKKFFNPRLFVQQSAILKLTDGHLNQNDAIEFYSRLIDYLDESLKGQRTRQLLQDLLFVKTGSMNMRHCPGSHRTETEVATPFLTLNIRSGMAGPTINSLQEALESSFKSEKLNGLQCEECNTSISSKSEGAGAGAGGASSSKDNDAKKDARYDADQIKYFARLPKVLVVQLQRFDFDYEAMQPTKLNHRVSFEEQIDLTKYTKEETLKQFETSDSNLEKTDSLDIDISTPSSESTSSPKNPIKKCIYKLQGVVVHQGSGANFGHYYSFIKDRQLNSWFKFDDERVTPFDIRKLDEECFGGLYESPSDTNPAMVSSLDKITSSQPEMSRGNISKHSRMNRNNNAYLLVYERCDSDKDETLNIESGILGLESSIKKEIPPLPILQKYSEKNNGKKFKFGFAEAVRLVLHIKSLTAKAKISLQGRKKLQEHQTEVWEDNQRTLRNGIGYATDFIDFCYSITKIVISKNLSNSSAIDEEIRSKVAKLGFLTFMKIAIRSESQKSKLTEWTRILRIILNSQPSIATWFIDHVTTDQDAQVKWIESILLRCTDNLSTNAFLLIMREIFSQLFSNASYSSNNEGMKKLMEFVDLVKNISSLIENSGSSQGQATYNSKFEIFKETRGTALFSLWNEIASIENEKVRNEIIQRDTIAYLLQFVQAQSILKESNSKNQPENDRVRDSQSVQMDYPILIEAIISLLGLSLQSKLLNQSSLYDQGDKSISELEEKNNFSDDNEYDDSGNMLRIKISQLCERINFNGGLPLMPKRSKQLLYDDESFMKFLCKSHDTSLSSSLLTALISRGNQKRSEFIIDSSLKLQGLIKKVCTTSETSMQYSQLLATPSGRDIIKKQIKAMYLHLTSQLLIEDFLSIPRAKVILENLLNEANSCLRAVDEISQDTSGHYYHLEEKYKYQQILSLFVYYTAKVIGSVYSQSDSCRTFLKQNLNRWKSFSEWLDQSSYLIAPMFKGNSNVYTRSVAKGRVVRAVYAAMLNAKGSEKIKVKFIEPQCSKFEVIDAGSQECNGFYSFDGFFEKGISEQVDTIIPKFVKNCENGLKLTIYQCKIKGGSFSWYISRLSNKPGTVNDVDYYCSHQDSHAHHGQLILAQLKGIAKPNENNWGTCKEGKKNPPKPVRLIHTRHQPNDYPLLEKSTPPNLQLTQNQDKITNSSSSRTITEDDEDGINVDEI